MSIDKIIEFAGAAPESDKNTNELDLSRGFPSRLHPARQWFNYLFNTVTKKINEIIDQSASLNNLKINYDDVVNNLTSTEIKKPLSANMGRLLDEKKLNKDDLVSGSAPVFAARAWANFNGNTGAVRKSGNIKSITRNKVGNYTIKFTVPMEHGDYAVISGVSSFDSGTTFGVVSQTAEEFVMRARFGGDNTVGDFDPVLAMFTVYC